MADNTRGIGWRVGDVVDDRYRIDRVHTDGGMGLVYRVRHLSWATDLAMKRPRPEVIAGGRDRFIAEAEAWVSLGLHPNVCGCHYVRVLDDVPLVFAEYVSGGSLRDWIDDGRLYAGGPDQAARRVLDLAIQFAWGLGHAHDKGLVHQDVKPSNVLIDVDGTAKVTDFGLARTRPMPLPAKDSAPGTTIADGPGVSIAVPGGGLTPAYASPEQAAGESLSRRTDVYSYAVSLLEMYTGGLTWLVGAAAPDVLATLRTDGADIPGPPALPSRVADLLDRCLRTDPAHRPASMSEIAAELVRIHRDEIGIEYSRAQPIPAQLRADELNNRALSLLDLRRPADAEAAFTDALAADPRHLPATYNLGLLRWRRGEITDTEAVAAVDGAGIDGSDPTLAALLSAHVQLERGDRTAARQILDNVDDTGDPELLRIRRVAAGPGDAQCVRSHPMPWYTFVPRTETAMGMTLPVAAPDMTIRLWRTGNRAWTSCEGELRRWDVDDRRFTTLGTGVSDGWDVTDDGRYAVTHGEDGLDLWSLDEGRPVRRNLKPRDGGERVRQIRTVPGGHSVLYFGLNDSAVTWFDLDSGRSAILGEGPAPVTAMCVGPDETLAVAYYDHTIGIWDFTSGERRYTLTGPSDGMVNTMAFTSDGRHLLTGGIDRFGATGDATDLNSLRLWELGRRRCLRTYPGIHTGRIRDIVTDGRQVYSAGKHEIRTSTLPGRQPAPWQPARPRRPQRLTELDRRVAGLVDLAESFAATGQSTQALGLLNRARAVPGHERDSRILAAWRSLGATMTRVSVRSAWDAGVLTGHTAQVFSVAMSADARIAVTGGVDRGARIWEVESRRCLHVLPDQPSIIDTVGITADGARALTATRDGAIGVWSIETGECLSLLSGVRTLGASPAWFSADGRWALVAAADFSVRLWDLANPESFRILERHTSGKASAVWLSPDGRTAAIAGGDDPGVRLWDVDSGDRRAGLGGHASPVRDLHFARDVAVTVGDDGTVLVWDTGTGECRRSLGRQPARTARLSPDGRFVITGGSDRLARIWSVDSGECVRVVEGHQAAVSGMDIDPSGRYLMTGGDDKLVRIWELDWELAGTS